MAIDFTSSASWDGQGANSVSLVFGNDATVTNLEYNEFQIVNFASTAKLKRVNYIQKEVDSASLTDITGFAPLASEGEASSNDKTFNVSWAESKGNWAKGDPYEAGTG